MIEALKQQIQILQSLLEASRDSISVSNRLDGLNTDLEALQKAIKQLETEKRDSEERLMQYLNSSKDTTP